MTIYILYSADYELYLGGNYTDETEVLINPTGQLLDLFDKLTIPLTLFADVFSFIRYRELNIVTFPQNAENQMKDAIRRGHDVQLHVHPHWNFTQIKEKSYTVQEDYFLLGKLGGNPEELYLKIRKLLITAKNYLHNLLGEVDENYTCIAFRAGGYGLQPNMTTIIKALQDSGFIIDSSIVPGFVLRNKINEVDFSGFPKRANYFLDSDGMIPSKNNQGIFEIPIASCNFTVWENFLSQLSVFLYFLYARTMHTTSTNSKMQEKGYALQFSPGENSHITQHSKYYNFIVETLYARFFYLDCSTDDKKMFLCTKNYLKQFDLTNTTVFFSFNMHPKGMTKDHFTALEKYHASLKMYYKDNIQAISYQKAAEMLLSSGKKITKPDNII
jgi:hypothetical protein